MSKVSNLKVSVSGVRGIVGDTLTPSLITKFSAAFGEYVGKGRVIVGRDSRPTGKMFEYAVIAGLQSVGCKPMLVGIVPTPTVQILVDEFNATGGIVITASHNPIEWNALKFIGKSGVFLNFTEAEELLNLYNQPDRNYVIEEDYRRIQVLDDSFMLQKKRIFAIIDKNIIKKRKLKVAVDCCNGAGALYSKAFLEELGCEVVSIFDETDGVFRRNPEPISENLTELSKVVVENKCDIGFAQDPDADRIVVINADGKAIGEQYSVILASEHILSQTPGDVVVNIQTSKAIEDVAKKYDSKVTFTPVGEINVTSKMLEIGAVIGGEGGSGGVIFPKVHPCRDSFTGMALIIEMLAMRKCSLQDILDTIPTYYSAGCKIPCQSAKGQDIIRMLTKKYADNNPNTIDGLRLNWDDSWVLLRLSNTEPIIRIFAEALTQEKADILINQFKKEIKV